MKPSLAAIGSIMCVSLMAQTVKLANGNWQENGISLVPASSVEFANAVQAVMPSKAAPNFASIYPYSFILRNMTSKTIIAFGVRWTCLDARGRVQTHDRVWSNLGNLTSALAIAPGAERLVTPVLNAGATLDPDVFTKELAPFSGCQSIVTSLEAVILSDGTAYGTDANNTIPRIQARMDAKHLVLTGALQAWQQGGSGSMSGYLNSLIAAAPPENGPLAAIYSPSVSTSYSAALSDSQTQFAKQFLQVAGSNPRAFVN
jgi:hypothetical protein